MSSERAATAAGLALTLITRRDCQLCEDFHAAVLAWDGARGQLQLQVIDVDTDARLMARYGLRVPVLLHGTDEICAFRFRGERLAALQASGD